MELPPRLTLESVREMRTAMRLSLVIGFLMLAGKVAAYMMTGSAAILSDAAESVVHVVAVGFAAFSLWLSSKPADPRFPFGYERISFFSAGFEGALIVLAAVSIVIAAVYKWIYGAPLERLGYGTLIVLGAAVLNTALGLYLLRISRRNKSLILEANGRHVLTDSLTSLGVVAGLGLVILTGWKPFDPIFAIAVALNILISGGRLVWRSIGGLLDYSEPAVREQVRTSTRTICGELGIGFHNLRLRNAGYRLIIHVHLLFRSETSVGEAHRIATLVEERLTGMLDTPAEVITHLESVEDHAEVHQQEHAPGIID